MFASITPASGCRVPVSAAIRSAGASACHARGPRSL